MANFRGWTIDEDQNPTVAYNPKLDQVFVLNDTKLGRRKELWRYDFESEGWMYGFDDDVSSVGLTKERNYTNFQLDQNVDLVTVGYTGSSQSGIFYKWDNVPASQRIRWNTGYLNLDGVSTNKQLYKVTTVAKKGTSLYLSGTALLRDGSTQSVSFSPTALHSGSEFGAVDHVENSDLNEEILFLELQVQGTDAADELFELHSISIVYRDKGVK